MQGNNNPKFDYKEHYIKLLSLKKLKPKTKYYDSKKITNRNLKTICFI